jgi:hypothetical protein
MENLKAEQIFVFITTDPKGNESIAAVKMNDT